jgi:predicted transcriptional regulator
MSIDFSILAKFSPPFVFFFDSSWGEKIDKTTAIENMKYHNQLLPVKGCRYLQDLCNLLFELSNVDRLNIMIELKKKPMKISHVSKKFGFTVQETSRNFSRLFDANLIFKDTDGAYHLTPYGEGTLNFLSGFKFLSKNKKYFVTHTLSALTPEFTKGLGAIANSEVIGEVTEGLYDFENMIREAKEYVWLMADQILASALPLITEAVNRGVEIKKILPRNANIPAGIFALANDPAFTRAARAQKLESRYLDKVDVVVFVSEKVATFGFPSLDGKFDYLGFCSRDETARKWLTSLYMHYWNQAKR